MTLNALQKGNKLGYDITCDSEARGKVLHVAEQNLLKYKYGRGE